MSNGSFNGALGMVETKGWVGLVEATDVMCKAASTVLMNRLSSNSLYNQGTSSAASACSRTRISRHDGQGGDLDWRGAADVPGRA